MKHFEAEMKALKTRAAGLKINIGSQEEMVALRSDTTVCVVLSFVQKLKTLYVEKPDTLNITKKQNKKKHN